MLEKFYALTTSNTLYKVSTEISNPEQGWPTVEKIEGAERGKMIKGGTLEHGTLIGIGNRICLFDPMPPMNRAFCKFNRMAWGGTTSPIVALFLGEATARAAHKNISGEESFLDPRYLRETLDVILAIGQDHPVFVLGGPVDPESEFFDPALAKTKSELSA